MITVIRKRADVRWAQPQRTVPYLLLRICVVEIVRLMERRRSVIHLMTPHLKGEKKLMLPGKPCWTQMHPVARD